MSNAAQIHTTGNHRIWFVTHWVWHFLTSCFPCTNWQNPSDPLQETSTATTLFSKAWKFTRWPAGEAKSHRPQKASERMEESSWSSWSFLSLGRFFYWKKKTHFWPKVFETSSFSFFKTISNGVGWNGPRAKLMVSQQPGTWHLLKNSWTNYINMPKSSKCLVLPCYTQKEKSNEITSQNPGWDYPY